MRNTKTSPKFRVVRGLATLLILFVPLTATADDSVDLAEFKSLDAKRLSPQDAKAAVREVPGRYVLRVDTGHAKRWPGVTMMSPLGGWDLSSRSYLSVGIRNAGDHRVKVSCRVDNPGADGRNHCVTENVFIDPGKRSSVTIPLVPRVFEEAEIKFIGMRGNPPVFSKLDPANVTSLVFFVADPKRDHVFEIESIRAGGVRPGKDGLTKDGFFPFIDELGQYVHADWPGKMHSVKDLVASAKIQEKALEAAPGPSDRNRYGGWTAGPQLAATGFFRVEKHRGKWWLVDPEGRLFWSHGVDCIHAGASTPISDREHYYRNLPKTGTELARFFGRGNWAPHGYYQDHSPYRTFDFFRANQLRKHGEDWEDVFIDVTHRRLRSWGLNTIGNWSGREVLRTKRTPYVATISSGGSPRLDGSKGYWGQFPDVFSPGFRKALSSRMKREREASIGDPWCIGFFVDNELSWGDETSLAIAALTSPSEQPAKKAFVDDLRAKYTSIEKLNSAWQTQHASWKALAQHREAPAKEGGAGRDLLAFYKKTAATYFRTIRDVIREQAPGQLYLGCRFAWVNDEAARVASKFCDVVGYNRYAYSVEGFRLPDDIDRPVIIGEFHFGALDRGLFHTGLRKARDQKHRAELYESYVLGALRNRHIVGTHWFQWKDQAATGRGDGENYQIGFIDVCDRPYPEIVEAARRIGKKMYRARSAAEEPDRP